MAGGPLGLQRRARARAQRLPGIARFLRLRGEKRTARSNEKQQEAVRSEIKGKLKLKSTTPGKAQGSVPGAVPRDLDSSRSSRRTQDRGAVWQEHVVNDKQSNALAANGPGRGRRRKFSAFTVSARQASSLQEQAKQEKRMLQEERRPKSSSGEQSTWHCLLVLRFSQRSSC